MINLPIKTTKSKFFRQVLEVLRSFPPINKLSPKELDLLAEFMKQNNELTDIPVNKRRILVFSTENRKEIMDTLNMSQAVFNNNLSKLRKVGVITRNNDLIPLLNISDINNFSINIKFNVQGSE